MNVDILWNDRKLHVLQRMTEILSNSLKKKKKTAGKM